MQNFTRQGLLTLQNGSSRVIWSSNATGRVQNPIAQLLDSGNLVVRDATANYLWQSFEYPGDIALPGMKVVSIVPSGHGRAEMTLPGMSLLVHSILVDSYRHLS